MKKLIKFYPYIVITLLALLISYKIFRPGFMLFLDNPSHLAMYKYYIEEIILKQHFIFGFSNLDFAGFPIASIYSQIGFYLIAIMNLLIHIPIELAYKMLVFASYLAPSLIIYFICSKYIDKKASLIVSLLYLLTWKDVILTVFGGMWTYSIGISSLLLFFYNSLKFYEDSDMKRIPVMIILITLTILSHPFATIGLFCLMISFVVAILIVESDPAIRIKKFFTLSAIFFIASFISLLITSFYLIPLFGTLNGWMDSYAWGLATNYPQMIYRLFLPLGFAVPHDLMLKDLFANPQSNIWHFFVASVPQLFIFFFALVGIKIYWKKNG